MPAISVAREGAGGGWGPMFWDDDIEEVAVPRPPPAVPTPLVAIARRASNSPRASRVAGQSAAKSPDPLDLPTDIITVGSDCAGLLTESLALELLAVPHKHAFMSERDPNVRRLIYQVYGKNMRLYKDCCKRNMAAVPRVHVYVFGFPCQPFSPAGKGLGLRDERATPLTACLEYVRQKRPLLVVAENSAGFASRRSPPPTRETDRSWKSSPRPPLLQA